MSEITTNEIVADKQMFVFDIKHNEYKSATLFKVAHAECFAEQYKCPANYTTGVDRQVTNARATCEFCGERLNPVEAAREEAAIKKWLDTGDRSDYEGYLVERNKRDGTASKSAPKYTNLGTVTGRMRSGKRSDHMESVPRSNANDVPAQLNKRKGVAVTGVESSGVRIVTHQEQALSDMSKLTDEELFGKE